MFLVVFFFFFFFFFFVVVFFVVVVVFRLLQILNQLFKKLDRSAVFRFAGVLFALKGHSFENQFQLFIISSNPFYYIYLFKCA